MYLKELSVNDSQAIADLHLKAFISFFLSSLGRKFLKIFYQTIIKNPNSIAFGLFNGEKLVAFSIGTSKKKGFYSKILKKSGLALLWAALPQLISKPQNITRLFFSLKSNEIENVKIANSACLLSICVDPEIGSKGYGKKVLRAFESKAFLFANTITLTTDTDDNQAANSFYLSNGYLLINILYQAKRKMNLYYKNHEN